MELWLWKMSLTADSSEVIFIFPLKLKPISHYLPKSQGSKDGYQALINFDLDFWRMSSSHTYKRIYGISHRNCMESWISVSEAIPNVALGWYLLSSTTFIFSNDWCFLRNHSFDGVLTVYGFNLNADVNTHFNSSVTCLFGLFCNISVIPSWQLANWHLLLHQHILRGEYHLVSNIHFWSTWLLIVLPTQIQVVWRWLFLLIRHLCLMKPF